MSTTIDSLDIQISTSTGSSAAKIQELANALGSLKDSAKITTAVNGLNKLAGALNTLNPALSALDTSKLKDLGTSVSGLSSLQKLSGLNSALNTLKKLPDVVNGLDAANLAKFATQMERLSKALSPLATQIDTISRGFAKLPSRVSQVVTATNQMAAATEKSTRAIKEQSVAVNAGKGINLMAAIYNFNEIMGAVQMVGNGFEYVMAQAMEWDGIQYRFGRAFGEDAGEVLAYAEKINDVLGINIQQFMQYSSLYGSLLSGFGMAQEKVTTISVGLTELSYDIWAAYNDRFKTLEDASEAVRSAITGEIEPIRNAGIALTEASLQEYMDEVGMATVSIEKLSEAQKAEVRYAAMMKAATNQGIVGTYASEIKTAEGAVRDLSQAFKSLTQAFGSLFIPIIQAAIPYVTALINVIYDVIAAIASFFKVSFFKIDWGNNSKGSSDFASNMEKAADSAGGVGGGMGAAADAAKKLRDYTMGFDELNVIQPPTESSGGGGGGGGGGGIDWGDGLDLKTLWDDSVFKQAERQVDELKQKILDWFDDWKVAIAIVAGALGAIGMATMLEHLGEALNLGDKFLGVMGTIKKLSTSAIVITLQYYFVHELLESFIEKGSWRDYILALVTTAIGSGILYSQWGNAGLVIGLAVTAVASFATAFADGKLDSIEEVVTGLTGLATAAGAVVIAWKKLAPAIAGSNLVQVLLGVKSGSAAASSALTFMFPTLSKIAVALSGAASAVGTFLAGITAPVWGTIAAVIAGIASVALFLARNWDEVVAAVKRFFEQNIAPKLEAISDHFDALVDALGPVGELIGDVFEDLWDSIKRVAGRIGDVLGGIGKALEVVGGVIFSVVGGVIAVAFDVFIGIVENVVQYISGFVQIISGMIDFIVALFEGGDVEAAWQKIWDGVVDCAEAVVGLVIDPVVDLVNGVIDWFTELWDVLVGHSIVPDTIDAIVEWFLSLPEKIFSPLQAFVEGVVKKFQDMWDSIKQWYNTDVAPKFTRAYWMNTFDKVVSGISSKLSEIKGAIAGKWQTIVEWYNTNVAPKLAFSYWVDKISSFVDVGKEIVENIKSGLKEKWDKLVEWWSELELPSFKIKTPHISWSSTEASGWIADTLAALGMPTRIPKLEVAWYAQGGFPGMGELFVAREAGPELVGKIGGRTAVANNDQIVAAVSQGVYSAVVAAMSSGGDGSAQTVNVYLDGKQIYSSMKKVEAERGVSIMGNQLGYAY